MEQSLHHRIRERAYKLWNGSGRMDGQADQHWLAAEREVLAEMSAQLPASDTSRRQRNIGSQRKEDRQGELTKLTAPAE